MDCETDSLEKAKKTYKDICVEEIPQEAIGSFRMILGLWAYIIPMILIVFFIMLALVMYALSKVNFQFELRVICTSEVIRSYLKKNYIIFLASIYNL